MIYRGIFIEITNLPYGRHTLRVKADRAGGVKSKEDLIIYITVPKPFYLQTWFIALSTVLLVIAIWQFIMYRLRSLREQKLLLEQTVKERTQQIEHDKELIEQQAAELKKLDKTKSRFFTNVSHELRTPLTLIKGPASKLSKSKSLKKQDQKLAHLIQTHSEFTGTTSQ